jgi:hypothetical protein
VLGDACYGRHVGRRLALVGVAVAIVAAGCAQAGSPGQPVDAPAGKGIDAPRAIDAHEPPPPDGPPAATCTTSATCATATMLAGIGGDEDGASQSSASGYQAAWYSIRVSETDSGPLADPMSMQTTLTSPSSAMFDLFVYIDTGNDDVDCTTPTGSVTTNGTSETSSIEWGETGTFANDSDDSRTVSIEVRPKSGDACSPSAPWSISIITGFD